MPLDQLYAFELGRKKILCKAELLNIFGQKNLIADTFETLIFHISAKPNQKLQDTLGGSVKIMKIIERFDIGKPQQTGIAIEKLLKEKFKNHQGKIPFAVNIYGSNKLNTIRIKETLNFCKKIIKSLGLNCRFVNKGAKNTNTATLHRAGVLKKGLDLCLIIDQKFIFLATTILMQNIDNYSKRDFDKPARDAKIGMLPPKLAQIMINLAGKDAKNIYDPFCGTGTILMESLLMGKKAYGSDINPKMISASEKNLQWLSTNPIFQIALPQEETYNLDIRDAQFLNLSPFSKKADAIVTEGYLGEPQSKIPSSEKRTQIFRELGNLYLNWLSSAYKSTKPDCKIITCLTAFKLNNKIEHFPDLEALLKLANYKLIAKFLYDRPDQIVAREILVLEKIN